MTVLLTVGLLAFCACSKSKRTSSLKGELNTELVSQHATSPASLKAISAHDDIPAVKQAGLKIVRERDHVFACWPERNYCVFFGHDPERTLSEQGVRYMLQRPLIRGIIEREAPKQKQPKSAVD